MGQSDDSVSFEDRLEGQVVVEADEYYRLKQEVKTVKALLLKLRRELQGDQSASSPVGVGQVRCVGVGGEVGVLLCESYTQQIRVPLTCSITSSSTQSSLEESLPTQLGMVYKVCVMCPPDHTQVHCSLLMHHV